MPQIESWFVIVMGIGFVFIGLLCIVLLCKILGAICALGQQKAPTSQVATAPAAAAPAAAPVAAAATFANRQEVIAAIGAAIAEEAGVEVDAIRIVSIKKV